MSKIEALAIFWGVLVVCFVMLTVWLASKAHDVNEKDDWRDR